MALQAFLIGGVPDQNMTLYHRVRFSAGDPAAYLILVDQTNDTSKTVFIVRDIEADRARAHAQADEVYAPKDLVPLDKLSVDREIGTAQAVVEVLRRQNLKQLVIERSTSVVYQHVMQAAGIDCICDPNWGSTARRRKSPLEMQLLRDAQAVTESVIQKACEFIARADTYDDGTLMADDKPLTSERVQSLIDLWLMEQGYGESSSIVAGGIQGSDCHTRGSGALRSSEPIIVDVFPRSKASRYWGDCTRTVVHGRIPERVLRMHDVVVRAKHAACEALHAGVTGDAVNAASLAVVMAAGFGTSTFGENDPIDAVSMVHGTGHGVGLAIHEAPLLVVGGPELVEGDVVTIEPGLYCRSLGGVRVEDMVAITKDGYENFNKLHEGLQWS